MDRTPVYTVGYGVRSLEQLAELLSKYGIQFLLDIRSHPYSKFKPEFTKSALRTSLEASGIHYVFMGDTLGGQPNDESCYRDGKVDYALVEEKPFYRAGIQRVLTAWEKGLPVALMCSEGKPEECHRSKLVGQTLVGQGIEVLHIDENGVLVPHDEVLARLTGGQQSMFNLLTSRKRYRETREEPGRG